MNVTGGSDRSRLLNLLSDVKAKIADSLGAVDFPIPQFVICGKQSVGKSRLIEALAGEQFNFVSGTLGSRRPTVLEFRHSTASKSKWYIRDSNNQWQEHPISRVLVLIGESHESLGATVSAQPIYVRVESPHCVDMQVVDLPGFRDFSIDDSKAALAQQIEDLVTSFMKDTRNVMLCVEQAGDAANMSTLARCQKIDPKYSRTILVRNKLDKFYGDLSFENINPWLEGFGDLPASLPKFTLTLPHWMEKGKNGETLDPPVPFVQLRGQMNDRDIQEIKAKGAASKHLDFIGFEKFAKAMEVKIEAMFAQAIGPIIKRLKEMDTTQTKRVENMLAEVRDTNPDTMVLTVREAGKSFAQALSHVLEGVVASTKGRQTLPEEMEDFALWVEQSGLDIDILPSEYFTSLDDYLEFLCNEVKIPAWDMPINGGAQYRRLLLELEAYIRMAENNHAASRVDVVQARGVSLNAVTWKEVVMKLLSAQAHLPMRRRMMYVAARLEHIFIKQGDAALEFMSKVAGAPDEHMFSSLLTKHSKLIEGNPLIRKLAMDAFNECVSSHTAEFQALYTQTLKSTFSNPFAFMKRTPFADGDPFSADGSLGGQQRELPTFEDTRRRVPEEMSMRGNVEGLLDTWLAEVPNEPSRIDEAVDKVQILLNLVYSAVRSQLADSLEMYAESFFKMPVLRRIEDSMAEIQLQDSDKDAYKARRTSLKQELAHLEEGSKVVKECLEKLQSFSLQTRAIGK